MSGRRLLWFVILVSVVIVIACVGGGVDLLVKQETGVDAKADITDCVGHDSRYTSVECSGTWVVGGSLLGNGHVIVGTVNGADRSDLGKTIDVKLSGGEAYTRSLTTAIVLMGVGLAWGVGLGFVLFAIVRRRRRPAPQS